MTKYCHITLKCNPPYEQEPESHKSSCICINISIWKMLLKPPGMCSSGERRNRDVFIVRTQSRKHPTDKRSCRNVLKVLLGNNKHLEVWTSPLYHCYYSCYYWNNCLGKEVHVIMHNTCRLLRWSGWENHLHATQTLLSCRVKQSAASALEDLPFHCQVLL